MMFYKIEIGKGCRGSAREFITKVLQKELKEGSSRFFFKEAHCSSRKIYLQLNNFRALHAIKEKFRVKKIEKTDFLDYILLDQSWQTLGAGEGINPGF